MGLTLCVYEKNGSKAWTLDLEIHKDGVLIKPRTVPP